MTVAALLTATGGAVALTAAPGSSSGPPSTAQQEQGMTVGAPFKDPANADIDAGANHDLTITLDAADTHFSLAGKKVWGESYDGGFVAPTLRFNPGAQLTIHLVNDLKVATNLHFHGMHVSPEDHSDDAFLCAAPGTTLTYQLAIPADHPQGTYWYHSHAMGTTCPAPGSPAAMDDVDTSMAGMANMPGMTETSSTSSTSGTSGTTSTPTTTGTPTPAPFMPGDVENQIFAGLSGAMVVGDDRTLLPAAYHGVEAHTFVFKDAQIDSGGHIVQNTATTSIDSNAPTVRLVNGQLRPTLTLRPNQTQLWRLANAGADIFYQLQLDGYHFTVVGEDGVPVARTRTADTLLLPPGKRYDVLVTANANAGQTWLRTTAYSNGPQGDQYPDTELVKVSVQGAGLTRLPEFSGAVRTAPADLAAAPIAQQRTVDLSESADGLSFYINGKQFDMNQSVFATPAKLGTVEEWTILNEAGEDHPFHLHVSPFQVMSINGVAQPYTHMQDTVPVPHAVNGVPGKVVIRVPFNDFPGRWMFHCHIAAHEDNGMMSYINVVS
ncbi:FtsP/CotA-like multicopper oxidase with cupredoxin domain [Catenulispora sp. EB89]|uniref:multicopper oxidase family protein n=1 Tax=Catenulispora sp. EB89 TaxID=3156257 RepID=UPI003513434A